MDYIPPHVDMNTPNIAQDNLTPDLTRICPICFDKWTGIGAQLIYHILQEHPEYLLKQEQNEYEVSNDQNEYTFMLLDNTNQNKEPVKESTEIVKIFIEYEKIFVLCIEQLSKESSNCGFSVTVNYIGPFLNKIECMKFTCMLQYDLNNKKCLSNISEVVGETAQFIIDDDMKEFNKAISFWPVSIKIEISVPKKFQELIVAVKNRLTCFSCKIMMRPPIKYCRYGHIICKNCQENIQSHPTCPSCYNDSIEFNENANLVSNQDLHPAMRLQNNINYSSFQTYNSAIVNEALGTGDVIHNEMVKLTIDKEVEVEDVMRSELGHMRLLEEDALQIVYCCDKDDCSIWISCLDLDEHKKEYH